jgi:predicted dehydrogenase
MTRYAAGRRNRHTFEIYGSKGAITWDMEDMNRIKFYSESDPDHLKGFRDILVTERCHEYANAWWPPGHIIGYEHGFVHAAADFLEAVKSGERITPDLNDNIKIIRVLEAALQSMEGAGKVFL